MTKDEYDHILKMRWALAASTDLIQQLLYEIQTQENKTKAAQTMIKINQEILDHLEIIDRPARISHA